MNPLIYAFAAGIRAARLALAPKTKELESKITKLESELQQAKGQLTQINTQSPNNRRIILMAQITNDSAERIRVKETDRLGAAVTGETLTATVDQPSKATVTQDASDPLAFVVSRLPLAEGDPDVLLVTVTVTDSANGFSDDYKVLFEPGKPVAMTFEGTLVPVEVPPVAAVLPAVGETVSLPANPADPASPTGDHTVTAVAADGSTITVQPVSGGDPVTVPAAALTAVS